MKKHTNYFISEHTYALISAYDELGERQCVVHCKGGESLINQSDLQVLNQSLALNGLTMKAAHESSKVVLKKQAMLPIDINPKECWIWFGLFSMRSQQNYWFSIDAIVDFYRVAKKETFVEFITGQYVIVPVSVSAFNRKYNLASKYKQLKEVRQKKVQMYLPQMLSSQVAEVKQHYLM